MGNSQTYTKATIYLNSNQLTQETSVTIKRESGSQPVKTVALGYAGESPGSGMTMISVSNAVPTADFEVNPGLFFVKADIPVEISIFAAGKTLTVKGSIFSDNFSHAVDGASKLDFEFRGGPADWE